MAFDPSEVGGRGAFLEKVLKWLVSPSMAYLESDRIVSGRNGGVMEMAWMIAAISPTWFDWWGPGIWKASLHGSLACFVGVYGDVVVLDVKFSGIVAGCSQVVFTGDRGVKEDIAVVLCCYDISCFMARVSVRFGGCV